MITDADRAKAEDLGCAAELVAAERGAKDALAAARCAFEMHVASPAHDITSEEYASLRGAYLDARRAYDAAFHATVQGSAS